MKYRIITCAVTVLIVSIFTIPSSYQVLAKTTHSNTASHSSKKKTTSVKKPVKGKIVKHSSSKTITPVPMVSKPAPTAQYTQTTVALHNSATNCWTTIKGSVYNLTPWIAKHSTGQQSVLTLCGVDSTAAFNTAYAGKTQPLQQLNQFLIGTLK